MKKGQWIILLVYVIGGILCAGVLSLPKPDRTQSYIETEQVGREETSEHPADITQGQTQTQPTKEVESQSKPELESETEPKEKPKTKPKTQSTTQPKQNTETDPQTEPDPQPYRSPVIWIATDIHYYSSQLTDYGPAFLDMIKKDDGKVTYYSPQLTDAFLWQVESQRPDALILSGDLTLNGERVNHMELAQKLKSVADTGIAVLVIPGNHDINNSHAATYYGEKREQTDSVTAEQFAEIYRDFGYQKALSRDESSLSYTYQLDEKNLLMMIDSCQYEPVNLVDGKIRQETTLWMKEQLAWAEQQGLFVLPVAHHNLLDESLLYTTECTIEDNLTFVDLFWQANIPLFVSGHLHLQRITRNRGAQEIYEAVTSSLSIAPCQFGVLSWQEDGSLIYRSQRTDVSAWAAIQGSTDPNLLDFQTYSDQFLLQAVADHMYGKLAYLPQGQMVTMSELYAKLNQLYCAGLPVDFSQIMKAAGYEQWERNRPDSKEFDQLMAIIQDTVSDHNYFMIKNSEESRTIEE